MPLLLTLVMCVSCATDDGESPPTPTDDVSPATDLPPAEGDTEADPDAGPILEPLPEGALESVETGGDTLCSRGTPYRFYARGGDPKRIVIDFQGGGACWDALTCSVAGAIFYEEAPTPEAIEAYWNSDQRSGIYALEDDRNPVKGWTFVHIPYCTGDIHWGDAVHTYTNEVSGYEFDIHHRGFVNSQAVLDWVYARYPDPEKILVTGCSAGAYGAIGHSPWIAERYPQADVVVVADSGAGVITDTFFQDSFPNWNVGEILPDWIEGIGDIDVMDLIIEDLYVAVGDAYPGMRVSQYNTAYDKDQGFYYEAMGGDRADWRALMEAKIADISSRADNFRYYKAPGQIHCVHPYAFYYDQEVNGVPYVDWLAAMIDGDDAPDSVGCEGDACLDDPICDACLDGSLDVSGCGWCDGWDPESRAGQ